jgi:hypothetical protein
MALDVSELLKGLDAARDKMLAAAEQAVDQYAEHVLGDAVQLTPVLTGALAASGTTLPIEVNGTSIKKEIAFNTDYAAAVHENLDAHHEVGQAKYLSTALEQNAPKLGPFIADAIKAVS